MFYLKEVKMNIAKARAFLKIFGAFSMSRHALKQVYRHTKLVKINPGEQLSFPDKKDDDRILFTIYGILNGFFIHEQNERINIWLGHSGSIIKPSEVKAILPEAFFIEAIEYTEVLEISQRKLEEIGLYFPNMEKHMIEHIFLKMIQDTNNRNTLFRMCNHTSRFNYFCEIYPGLEKKLPKDLLDTYIRPSTL
ncbi:hypothetical protein GCM10011413_09910 [Pedobacter psychrotolerans]|uniref:CRP-like cAMP-binding protein n=2 Tax=Pedobacter psychrotolerans TaxID=1843235 RepID=A0ABQ1SNK7_9SPHI|nr:hypothetical protein GCM10011413_09910 [Pedobacter psychrotolerans]